LLNQLFFVKGISLKHGELVKTRRRGEEEKRRRGEEEKRRGIY
jgi:hypothetical protein